MPLTAYDAVYSSALCSIDHAKSNGQAWTVVAERLARRG
jgi:hypothetical protein